MFAWNYLMFTDFKAFYILLRKLKQMFEENFKFLKLFLFVNKFIN